MLSDNTQTATGLYFLPCFLFFFFFIIFSCLGVPVEVRSHLGPEEKDIEITIGFHPQ